MTEITEKKLPHSPTPCKLEADPVSGHTLDLAGNSFYTYSYAKVLFTHLDIHNNNNNNKSRNMKKDFFFPISIARLMCTKHSGKNCLLVGCLTSQQHASVSQGRICTDNFTCCHTEIQVADPTFYLTQSQYTDTGPTSPSADPITPGAWQGSHWSANF